VCVFWTLQGIAAVEKFKYFGIFIFEPPFWKKFLIKVLGPSLKECDIATIFNMGLDTD
jgi:hypothetical protein